MAEMKRRDFLKVLASATCAITLLPAASLLPEGVAAKPIKATVMWEELRSDIRFGTVTRCRVTPHKRSSIRPFNMTRSVDEEDVADQIERTNRGELPLWILDELSKRNLVLDEVDNLSLSTVPVGWKGIKLVGA